ncbi:MAG TPA: YifB family Mg chelatase-like AAA ATPase [Candidatus Limnocylindrales bacterium]|nr:YifB family Mg chelatase-like AAA ATPase [Candidatus Limnocylindrales bacterium]
MLAIVPSATLHGLDGRLIRVEVDVAPGLPGFTIVGLADAALQEARERVRGALRNAGFVYPPRRITVNLAPADLRKAGASLDLAIAIGILLGSEQVRPGGGRTALIGELSLGGEVRSVPGVLPMVAALARRGVRRVVVAASAVEEGRLVEGIDVVGVEGLSGAVEQVRARRPRRAAASPPRVELVERLPSTDQAEEPPPASLGGRRVPDLAEVRGQPEARRALEIALAGRHGLLLLGPPGSGKTLLARTIPGLLPPLDDAAALAATVIASAAGEGPIHALRRRPPFRAPHHTISYAAMVGGGPRLSPGEITRADQGVLFLDELPEFGRDVLEALRQPMEEGRVAIARAGRATIFPARFQLVAAMNPCPCGYAGLGERACACPGTLPERYQRRVSGPLRDRIDLWVSMPRVAALSLVGGAEPEDSATVARRIVAGRGRALGRASNGENGRLTGRVLRAACGLSAPAERRVVQLAELERASGRGTERLLRVARTIADLAGDEVVREEHLDEAAWFRPADLRLAAAEAG